MPGETEDQIEKTSEDVEMDRQNESETPLTLENLSEPKEKPLAYANLVVTNSNTAFGRSITKRSLTSSFSLITCLDEQSDLDKLRHSVGDKQFFLF